MKIGYACNNWSITKSTNNTFRLASFSEERFIETAKKNISHLKEILEWNRARNLLFFRIGSSMIPFASHPVCTVEWEKIFKEDLEEVGEYITTHNFRISMHPGQFLILNSPDEDVVDRSIQELMYHALLLDTMQLDSSHKIQIHVEGVYRDKNLATKRFMERYKKLPQAIKRRLAIENDDRLFSLLDTMTIHKETGIPVISDSFHHECLQSGESMRDALKIASFTWKGGMEK